MKGYGLKRNKLPAPKVTPAAGSPGQTGPALRDLLDKAGYMSDREHDLEQLRELVVKPLEALCQDLTDTEVKALRLMLSELYPSLLDQCVAEILQRTRSKGGVPWLRTQK